MENINILYDEKETWSITEKEQSHVLTDHDCFREPGYTHDHDCPDQPLIMTNIAYYP